VRIQAHAGAQKGMRKPRTKNGSMPLLQPLVMYRARAAAHRCNWQCMVLMGMQLTSYSLSRNMYSELHRCVSHATGDTS
jgi:hypothetical protein